MTSVRNRRLPRKNADLRIGPMVAFPAWRGVKLLLTPEGTMLARIVFAGLLSLSTFALTTVAVHAHGGGLDSHGCHHDRKHGGYHCHQGAFAGQSFASKQEMLNALQAQSQPAKDLPSKV